MVAGRERACYGPHVMLGPILDGPHVRLGPPQPEHLPTFTRWSDIGVTQYLLHRHLPSLKQEEDWLEKMAASEHDAVWAITLQDTGALIGTTGLHNIAWRHRHAWSGIMLGERAAWGHN